MSRLGCISDYRDAMFGLSESRSTRIKDTTCHFILPCHTATNSINADKSYKNRLDLRHFTESIFSWIIRSIKRLHDRLLHLKRLLLTLFLLVLTNILWSQVSTSYIYLEGIKSLNFYVKMNGEVLPVLNKNYYIIPVAQSGETIIEISFLKDEYPRQNFMLNINLNSSFAYKLAKKETNHFYLLDLINEGKVVEANSMVNIGTATPDNRINFQNTLAKENKAVVRSDNKVPIKKQNKVEVKPKENEVVTIKTTEPVKPASNQKSQNQSSNVVKKEPDGNKKINIDSFPNPGVYREPNKKVIVSNCSFYATDKEVKTIIDHMSYKSKDEDKFILLKKKIFSGCLSIQQTALILSSFQGQPTRLAALRFLRPTIFDIAEFGSLQYLFKSSSYRDKVITLMYE